MKVSTPLPKGAMFKGKLPMYTGNIVANSHKGKMNMKGHSGHVPKRGRTS